MSRHIARTIAERSAGMIVPYDAGGLVEAIAGLIDDRQRYERLRENAVALAAEYDWNTIWKRTFAAMGSIMRENGARD